MATISWAVAASGDWHTRSDWSSGTIPGAGDDVLLATPGRYTITYSSETSSVASLTATTDRLVVSGGVLRIDGAAALHAGLTLAGGALGFAEGGTIAGGLTAKGGTLSIGGGSVVAVRGAASFGGGALLNGPGTLATSGATRIGAQGGAWQIGGGGTWNNTGTASLAGALDAVGPASLVNAAGASLLLTAKGARILAGTGRVTLANAGTLAKTTAAGTDTIEATLDSTGTVSLAGGTLLLSAAAQLGGVLAGAGTLELAGAGNQLAGLSAAAGSAVVLAGGIGAAISGCTLGTLRLAGGQIVASGNDTVQGGLSVAGGTVFVSAGMTLSILGSSVLQGGATLSGAAGLLSLGGVADIGADGLATTLLNLAMTETGAASVHAALDSSGNVQIGIAAGATWALDADAAGIIDLSGLSHLTVAGTLAKLAGSGQSRIDSVVASTGTLEAAAGTLALYGGGSIAGAVTGGGTLLLGGGTVSIAAGTRLPVAGFVVAGGSVASAARLAGTVGVLGGALELQERGRDTLGTLTLGAATLTLDGGVTLAVSGSASLDGGTLVGPTLLGPGHLLTLGTTAVGVDGIAFGPSLSWGNAGTATLEGVLQGGDHATNQATGVIELAGNAASLLLGGTLTNEGTLAKTAGSGVSTVAGALVSTGTLSAAAGTLALGGGGVLSGSLGGAGTLLFGGGTFAVASGATVDPADLAVSAGAVTFGDTAAVAHIAVDGLGISGGALLLAGGASLAVAGTVQLSGGGTLGGAGALATTGAVSLGADGQTVSLAGGLVWSASGTVSALGGVVGAGSGSVSIEIAGGAAFDLGADAAGITDGGSVVVLDNAGTLAKTGGSGTSQVFASVTSTGTLLAAAGTLALVFAPSLSGVAGGEGGLLLLENGASSDGALTVADNGGTASVRVASGYVIWTNSGSVADAGQVRLGDGSGNGPAILYNAPGAVWAFTGDDGGIAADAQGQVTNGGLLRKVAGAGVSTVAGTLANNGTIEAASGTLALLGSIGGSGTLQVATGATLALAQAPSASQTYVFVGAGGVLRLDLPASVAGPIQGFGQGDGIDFSSLDVSGARVAGDVLSVVAGGTTYDFTAAQSLAGLQPQIAPDGAGGSLVTLAAAAPAAELPVFKPH